MRTIIRMTMHHELRESMRSAMIRLAMYTFVLANKLLHCS